MLSFTMTILLASLTVQFLHGESFCSLMLQMWSKLNMLFRWAVSISSCRRQIGHIYIMYMAPGTYMVPKEKTVGL